jgi:hypothetical protein
MMSDNEISYQVPSHNGPWSTRQKRNKWEIHLSLRICNFGFLSRKTRECVRSARKKRADDTEVRRPGPNAYEGKPHDRPCTAFWRQLPPTEERVVPVPSESAPRKKKNIKHKYRQKTLLHMVRPPLPNLWMCLYFCAEPLDATRMVLPRVAF